MCYQSAEHCFWLFLLPQRWLMSPYSPQASQSTLPEQWPPMTLTEIKDVLGKISSDGECAQKKQVVLIRAGITKDDI